MQGYYNYKYQLNYLDWPLTLDQIFIPRCRMTHVFVFTVNIGLDLADSSSKKFDIIEYAK